MTPLYRNSRAARPRFLQVLFWAAALGFVALGVAGLSPDAAPGAWIISAIMAPLFALAALGMELYLRHYVTAVTASAEGLTIETLATFGRARTVVPWREVRLGAEQHEAVDDEDAVNVNALSQTLFVRGKALILDTTADAFDAAAMRAAKRSAYD